MASLRSRLTAAVMMPLLGLAAVFGGITCWMIHRTDSIASDRLLVGSVTLISRAIDADDSVRDKLLPLAIHLLQSRSEPETYFSVYDGDRLLAGVRALTPPADYDARTGAGSPRHAAASFPRTFRDRPVVRGYVDAHDAQGVIQPAYLRDAVIEGKPARVATEVRVLHRSSRPVVIQVADFLDDRQAYEQTYFLRVLAAGILIAMIAVLLFYWAITWGLRPFALLTAQIETARKAPLSHFRLDLGRDEPREALLLAQAFNELMTRTERAVASLREFTANASHQLRTPLAIMRVHVDVLEHHDPSTPRGVTALADIGEAVDSLERLMQQLISLARLDEQGEVFDLLAAFDLAKIASGVVAGRVVQADTESMDIAFEADGSAVTALGHAMLASEMIGNLLDNAIRYNRADGSVCVRVLRRDGAPCVEIEDDGPGIAPADAERVWERFYRAPGIDAPRGSGLGLPIVQALAERMGARVSLATGAKGRGVLATIVFRKAAASDEALPEPSSWQPRQMTAS